MTNILQNGDFMSPDITGFIPAPYEIQYYNLQRLILVGINNNLNNTKKYRSRIYLLKGIVLKTSHNILLNISTLPC